VSGGKPNRAEDRMKGDGDMIGQAYITRDQNAGSSGWLQVDWALRGPGMGVTTGIGVSPGGDCEKKQLLTSRAMGKREQSEARTDANS